MVGFTRVYERSLCQPREVLVEVFQAYPEDTLHIYTPSCVVLKRCGGCCNDESVECAPTRSRNVTLQVSPDRDPRPPRRRNVLSSCSNSELRRC